MANLTKANLVEALHQKGVPVPSGSPKRELLVKLQRQHVLKDGRFTSGDYSSGEDVRDTSRPHDDSYTLPEVSDSITSLSDDTLFAKLRDFGFQAGPVVASTRSLYERQLQQLLNNGSVPTTPSVPTNEFSATEEEEKEEPQVIPEDNSDEQDGGTPLQKGPTTFFPLSAQSVWFNLSNSNSPGVNEAVQPSRRSFTYSTRSGSLPQAGSPVHMTLRSRARTYGEDMTGHSAATTPAVGKQRRMSMAVKVLIVLVVITVNLLIYLRTPVEQGCELSEKQRVRGESQVYEVWVDTVRPRLASFLGAGSPEQRVTLMSNDDVPLSRAILRVQPQTHSNKC
ncbi:hypothetical protein HPB47_020840 [Ixodes persulcatus]|uniref:Uncharacterized protein n=1 Tax=Ixodes persulcatus TaxID=34615 RepID=A0AC60QE96_IXOPE|nr:hypothetical protein HPB47_020840 [Ixodes persulcatus]